MDEPDPSSLLPTLTLYLCIPFFAAYLCLGVALADDPTSHVVSFHTLWDVASFVPYLLAYTAGPAIRRAMPAGPDEVGRRR